VLTVLRSSERLLKKSNIAAGIMRSMKCCDGAKILMAASRFTSHARRVGSIRIKDAVQTMNRDCFFVLAIRRTALFNMLIYKVYADRESFVKV